MSSTDEVMVVPIPDANTNEMVTLLHEMIESLLHQLPFPFSYADIMGAALYHVVEGGLVNAESPEKLRQDIVEAIDRIIPELLGRKGKMN